MLFRSRGADPSIPLPPGSRGGIAATFLAPYEGDYEIRATTNPAIFTVDGLKVDTNGKTHLTAGNHTLIAANASRSMAESEGFLFGFVPGAAGTGYASTGVNAGGGVGGGGRGGAAGAAGLVVLVGAEMAASTTLLPVRLTVADT